MKGLKRGGDGGLTSPREIKVEQVGACFKNGKNVGYLWRTCGMAISWTKPVPQVLLQPLDLLKSRSVISESLERLYFKDDNGLSG